MSPAAKENLTFQKNVDDLSALVKQLRVGKVKLFCHSMGTLVGMEFVKRHPETVSNVVLAGAVLSQAETSESVFSERMNKQARELENRNEVGRLLKPYMDKGYDPKTWFYDSGKFKNLDEMERSDLTNREVTDA